MKTPEPDENDENYIEKLGCDKCTLIFEALISSVYSAVEFMLDCIKSITPLIVFSLLFVFGVLGIIRLTLFGIDSFAGKTLIEQIALAGFMAFLVFLATTAVFFCIKMFPQEGPGEDIDSYYSKIKKEDMMKDAKHIYMYEKFGYHYMLRDHDECPHAKTNPDDE